MSAKFTGMSDRGEQMRHRAQNLHVRHMSDVRGAVGCYYCWIGQYSRCQSQCQLVRVTDRDHRLAQTGAAADHRDVLHAWDHSAPVLTHAAAQANTFYNVPPPKEALKWVNSATATGGKQFLGRGDFVTVTKHVPSENPWITASRREENRALLHSISSNVNKTAAERVAQHARRHEKKLFSLLQPEQFVPPYKYAHGSITVQATPYTQISMKQTNKRALSAGASSRGQTHAASPPSRTARRGETLDGWGVYDGDGFGDARDAAAEARARATEQRRQNEAALRAANRPIFMQTKHGGRYVAASSAVYSGSAVKAAGSPARSDGGDSDGATAWEDEQQQLNQVLSTAEQLRAALEGRSIQQLRQDKLDALRAKNSAAVMRGSHGVRTPLYAGRQASASNPAVSMETTGGLVLSGRFDQAQAMPLPDAFAF